MAVLEVVKPRWIWIRFFAQWDRGHKPLFLPVVKAGEHTVVFLCDTCGLKYVVVQFLLCVCHIQN